MAQNKWVLRNKLAELYGYSLAAIEHKRKDGTWLEGRIWAQRQH